MSVNRYFRSIQTVQQEYQQKLDALTYEKQAQHPLSQQLDAAFSQIASTTAVKLIHPLLIKRYSNPRKKYRSSPLTCVGLDVETQADTGEPKLLGLYYPEPYKRYYSNLNPNVNTLYEIVLGLGAKKDWHIVVWGNLDIQILLRLFDPNERERELLSRGIGAKVKDGEFVANPPIQRRIGNDVLFVSHYIPGRSLKLGILDSKGYESTVWVFNLSQFFPGTIAQTARGLQVEWTDHGKDSHLVDWELYETDNEYRTRVIESNEQDAKTVHQFSVILQDQFYATFEAYPSLLVSTGSLTDAAIGKLLPYEDYCACSWDWLKKRTWRDLDDTVHEAETLLAEAFSAGYVDQFAVGYFERICTADIAAAYPHKIRTLPDLRFCDLIYGETEQALANIFAQYDVETVIYRGQVTIPKSLRFHPITVKTFHRENFRPQGTFFAAYTHEERSFVAEHGGSFEHEQWCTVVTYRRVLSPVARVSLMLGDLRNGLLEKLSQAKEADDRELSAFLDGQQYVTKVIDNSIYGKTVMTIEEVENIGEHPRIIGYVAGDRFNQLLGVLITARTRVQIAEACCEIEANGGRPVMTMTDSVYWEGTPDMLPEHLIRHEKTPGYFEPVKVVYDFYLLKTGQYEYHEAMPDSQGKYWHYKLRGLPVSWEHLAGDQSFYRRNLELQTTDLPRGTHARDVLVTVDTRRLISIGSHELTKLGKIEETQTQIKPFVLSSKQAEHYVYQWRKAINGVVWLKTPHIDTRQKALAAYPLYFMRELYVQARELLAREILERTREFTRERVASIRRLKKTYILLASAATGIPPMPDYHLEDLPWRTLVDHYGISRESLRI